MFAWLSAASKATYWFLAAIPGLLKLLIEIGKNQRDREYKSVSSDISAIRASLEESMSGTTFTLLLSTFGKLLDKLPDYDQRKKEQFYDLRKAYLYEKSKEIYGTRPGMDRNKCQDNNKIATLREQITLLIQTFEKEIGA